MYQKWTNILHGFIFANVKKYYNKAKHRGGSRNSAASKMALFFDKRSRIKAVNYCHKEFRIRCCSKSRSAFEILLFLNFLLLDVPVHINFYKTKTNWFCACTHLFSTQRIYLFHKKNSTYRLFIPSFPVLPEFIDFTQLSLSFNCFSETWSWNPHWTRTLTSEQKR